jgi:hypothetical protein
VYPATSRESLCRKTMNRASTTVRLSAANPALAFDDVALFVAGRRDSTAAAEHGADRRLNRGPFVGAARPPETRSARRRQVLTCGRSPASRPAICRGR